MSLSPRAAVILLCLALAGCGIPSFLITPVQNTRALAEETVEDGKGLNSGKIAIIQIEGMLIDAPKGGFLQGTENSLSLFTQQLNQAEKDQSVKAVVLRINSPGGTVTTSDTMYEMLVRFKEKTHKPVIASTQEICASGAYYLACAADKIVAHPTSLVGSIGVIFQTIEFKDLLDHWGIHAGAVVSGPLKEMGSPFKHATGNETTVMQTMVDQYFLRFTKVVRDHRPLKEQGPPQPMPGDYSGVFSGRVFTGEDAVKLGLADQTGLLQDALALARQIAHAPNAAIVIYRRPHGYGGSIYAHQDPLQPMTNTLQLSLPGSGQYLTTGFYYLWQPSMH